MVQGKFERRFPSVQNAVDIFADKWASDLSDLCHVTGTGPAKLFSDSRIKLAAESLGFGGRFNGMKILELGPLEAAHTYQLEQLGASSVLAIEANTEAFLKCLVVKEILNLRSHFLCGDVVEYLIQTKEPFDLIFCSGILYHMEDPIKLIKLICDHCPKAFVWTHYQSEDLKTPSNRKPRLASSCGFETTYYELTYANTDQGRFWGGNHATAAWLEPSEIIRAFEHFGLSSSKILRDDPTHQAGANFSLAVWR